jgi:hypothetical protein
MYLEYVVSSFSKCLCIIFLKCLWAIFLFVASMHPFLRLSYILCSHIEAALFALFLSQGGCNYFSKLDIKYV